MSDNYGYGQGNRYPGQPRRRPADETDPQRAVNFLEEATGDQSRRKFLRVAVMSGVGVAAVGATAGVAAACQKFVPIVQGNEGPTPTPVPSGTDPCSMCFEDTNFIKISEFEVQNGNVSPGQFYLWFIVRDLPQGTYTMSITQDGGTFPSNPFAYPSGKGQYAQVFQMPAGTSNHNGCPTGLPTNATKTQSNSTVETAFPFTTTGTGNVDLWLAVHLAWVKQDDNYAQTKYNFKGTLTGTTTISCNPGVSVTGKPKHS